MKLGESAGGITPSPETTNKRLSGSFTNWRRSLPRLLRASRSIDISLFNKSGTMDHLSPQEPTASVDPIIALKGRLKGAEQEQDGIRTDTASVTSHVQTFTFTADITNDIATLEARENEEFANFLAERTRKNEQLGKENRKFLQECGRILEIKLRSADIHSDKTNPTFAHGTVVFTEPEQWIAHRANTIFAVPPQDAQVGVQQYFYKTYFTGTPTDYLAAKRPLPLWIVGERLKLDNNRFHEYLVLVPTALTKKLTTEKGTSPQYKDENYGHTKFSVAYIATKHPLVRPNPVPTQDEVDAAYDPNTKTYTFRQFRTDKEAKGFPTANRFELLSQVSDATMEIFDVSRHIAGFMGSFDQLKALDSRIHNFALARSHILKSHE